jgi:hypothetical protein
MMSTLEIDECVDQETSVPTTQSLTRRQKLQLRLQRTKANPRLQNVGNTLQKLNLLRAIGQMEQDQELADQLEFVNQEAQEEAARKELCRKALAACQAEMEEHLEVFLQQNPDASYEDWIQDLHPENVEQGKLFPDMKQVDLRFYVRSSDHRLLWNEWVPKRAVPARSFEEKPEDATNVDLLDNECMVDDVLLFDIHIK